MSRIPLKDIHKMRLALLREFKNMRKFIDSMEQGVKSRDPARIYPAYIFMKTLVRHMNEGDLTPLSVELHQELAHSFHEDQNQQENHLAD